MYISALNTKRNPDIIMPGTKFFKGNTYFTTVAGKQPEKEEGEEEEDSEEEHEDAIDVPVEEDEYAKL